ncbi:MAG: histidine phosphatase family protein [Pseudomonadota bacterium]
MNTTTRWWWIRHGPVDSQGIIYGQQDLHADTSDQRTFQALAAQIPSDAVWLTSHLTRTKQTAQAIHDERAELVPKDGMAVERRFAEQHFGHWQGRGYAELAEERGDAWHRFWLAPAHEVPPGGESFAQLVERVGEGIAEMNQRHGDRDLVVVAHGGTIRAAIAHALGLDPERALAFTIDTCSLTRLDHIAGPAGSHDTETDGAGVWRIVALNRVF